MANGKQEQTTDQAELLAQLFHKDSIEYQLLLRYAQKKQIRSPGDSSQGNSVGEVKVASPLQPQDCRKRRKHKKLKLSKIIRCIRPVNEDDGNVTGPGRFPAAVDSGPDQEEVDKIVNSMRKITDCVHFLSMDIESDGDDVVERIVELLREQGDKLNEEIEKNHNLRKQLQDCLSYSFFTKVAQTFMTRLSPEEIPTAQSPKQAELALTFELTYRLNAMDCHPMNRVLGFGAKYLQDYFSPWVMKQGGYEKFFSDDIDAEEEVH